MKKYLAASIVIPSFNGLHLLKTNLPYVLEACITFKGTTEIIILDDGSTDGTTKWLREALPAITIHTLSENKGFAVAVNTGMKLAHYPIVILLNNDIRVEKDFLEPLLGNLTDPDKFATVACMRNPDDPMKIESVTRLKWEMGFLRTAWPTQEEVCRFPDNGEIFYACAGAAAYNRKIFLALNGFENIYQPFYWEDTDISYRAWKRGLRSTFCRESIVWHKPSQTIGKVMSDQRVNRIWERNKLLFQWRNLSSEKMFKEHIYWFFRHLLWLTRSGNTHMLHAWTTAAGKFSIARRHLIQEMKKAIISDEELVMRLG